MTTPIRFDLRRPDARPLKLAAGILAAVIVLWAWPAAAQGQAGLQRAVAALVARYERASGAVVGVSVRDTATADTLVEIRSGESFVPASNLKLLTVAAALERLGADFQFVTRVYCRGRDVIVVGDFDPTLGDPRLADELDRSIYAELDAWSAAIVEHLAGRSVGDIILLTPGFSTGSRPATWPDRHYASWFGAPVAPLNFCGNCIGVTFDLSGGRVRPTLTPTSRHISVVNNIVPGSRHVWSLRANADVSVVTLTGRVTASTGQFSPVGNPQMLLGRVLADRLARAGATVDGGIRVDSDSGSPPDDAVLVAEIRTPIAYAIWLADKHSLNMAAECLLLRSGDGTWEGSAQVMTDTLVEAFGIGADDLTIRDGSGLSPDNRVTPAAMTSVLAAAVTGDGGELLLNSLLIVGREGRMVDRLSAPAYRGRALAKTGYISGAQCLSGFILDTDGRPALTYSILVNRVPDGRGKVAQQLHDDICRRLIDALDARRQE